MKIYSKPIVLILFVLFLTACGADAAPEGAPVSDIYTAAAETLAAQVIPTTVSTATSLAIASPTPFAFPTAGLATPTSQSIVSYASSSQSTANGCNNATFVSDVTISDGTVLAPAESFVKTWRFQNSGTCTWSEDYLLTFVSGNDMDGNTTETEAEVASGSTSDLSVSLVAPSSEGTYTGYWRLADEDGNVFGQSVYVMIVVSDDASTLTPTSTEETTESTSTPTATTAATETFTPTTAPTATTVSADTSVPTTSSSE
jgi:hypothetical protein